MPDQLKPYLENNRHVKMACTIGASHFCMYRFYSISM